MSATNPDYLALLKFGIFVPAANRDEVLKMVKTNPAYKDDFENVKNNLRTMVDEDAFLEDITNSHKKISEIAQNNKVIAERENTFQIRAINPDHIASLTERAFFNSFNLERNVLNDLQEENKKNSSCSSKENKVSEKEEAFRENKSVYNEVEEEQKCICGKLIPESMWIQCSNEAKCRGSSWYHLKCAGIKDIQAEEVQKIDFLCDLCKRTLDEEVEGESSPSKRIKRDNS